MSRLVSRSRSAARRRPSGFTLIEVLVALAIFTMVAIPLLNLELSATTQTARVNLKRRAHTMAVTYMDQWRNENFQGDRDEKVGEFEIRSSSADMEFLVGVERFRVDVYVQGATEPEAEVSIYRAK